MLVLLIHFRYIVRYLFLCNNNNHNNNNNSNNNNIKIIIIIILTMIIIIIIIIFFNVPQFICQIRQLNTIQLVKL